MKDVYRDLVNKRTWSHGKAVQMGHISEDIHVDVFRQLIFSLMTEKREKI